MADHKHSLATKEKTPMKRQQTSTRGRGLQVAFSIALLSISAVLTASGSPFAFGNTASLTTARYRHTATLLPNGQVLVAGGEGNGISALSSAELYDPASGTWGVTGSLTTARYIHTATLLPN